MRLHDADLHAHSILVSQLTQTFAAHLGFAWRDQRLLESAALLHDIGKLRIAASVLQKPIALNESEWEMIHAHPTMGCSVLESAGIADPVVWDTVQNHHERLDGTGYPAGLHGKQVSEVVRIITLCDVFAALTETRSYGKPYTWQAALARMSEKHTRLDLRFLAHFKVMIAVRETQGSNRRRAPLRIYCNIEVKYAGDHTET
jgi:putative nucleotidyltransferase with HDIG domain